MTKIIYAIILFTSMVSWSLLYMYVWWMESKLLEEWWICDVQGAGHCAQEINHSMSRLSRSADLPYMLASLCRLMTALSMILYWSLSWKLFTWLWRSDRLVFWAHLDCAAGIGQKTWKALWTRSFLQSWWAHESSEQHTCKTSHILELDLEYSSAYSATMYSAAPRHTCMCSYEQDAWISC